MTARTPVRPAAEQIWSRSETRKGGLTHIVRRRNEGGVDKAWCGAGSIYASRVDGPSVDFPRCRHCVDQMAFPAGWYVYTFEDEAGNALYVGCTGNVPARMVSHERTKAWWPSVARTKLLPFEDMLVASEAEQALIYSLRPVHNVIPSTPYSVQGPYVTVTS